jgi:hypothetical protein
LSNLSGPDGWYDVPDDAQAAETATTPRASNRAPSFFFMISPLLFSNRAAGHPRFVEEYTAARRSDRRLFVS